MQDFFVSKFMLKFIYKNKKTIGTLILCFLLLIFVKASQIQNSQEKLPQPFSSPDIVEEPVAAHILPTKTTLQINDVIYKDDIEGVISVYDFMNKLRTEGKIKFTEKNYIGMGKFSAGVRVTLAWRVGSFTLSEELSGFKPAV